MGLESASIGNPQMPEWTRPFEEAGYKCILQDDTKRAKGQLTANATLVNQQRVEVVEMVHKSRSTILWLRTKANDSS
jgi:hypothetical protein